MLSKPTSALTPKVQPSPVVGRSIMYGEIASGGNGERSSWATVRRGWLLTPGRHQVFASPFRERHGVCFHVFRRGTAGVAHQAPQRRSAAGRGPARREPRDCLGHGVRPWRDAGALVQIRGGHECKRSPSHQREHPRSSSRPYLPDKKPIIAAYTATCWTKLLRPPKGKGWTGPAASAGDCFCFCLTHPEVDLVISAPKTAAQMREDMQAIARGPLTDDDMARMRALGKAVHG